MLDNNIDEKNKTKFLDKVESIMETLSGVDVKDIEEI